MKVYIRPLFCHWDKALVHSALPQKFSKLLWHLILQFEMETNQIMKWHLNSPVLPGEALLYFKIEIRRNSEISVKAYKNPLSSRDTVYILSWTHKVKPRVWYLTFSLCSWRFPMNLLTLEIVGAFGYLLVTAYWSGQGNLSMVKQSLVLLYEN